MNNVNRVNRRAAWRHFRASLLTLITGRHHYFSTSCLHGDCAYCECRTGITGDPKKPGECKSCTARCRDTCHTKIAPDGTPAVFGWLIAALLLVLMVVDTETS